MVRWPAAVEAAECARNRPGLSLGLHVDFGEWTYKDDNWTPVYNVVPLDEVTELRREALRQIAVFRNLTGRDPDHIDFSSARASSRAGTLCGTRSRSGVEGSSTRLHAGDTLLRALLRANRRGLALCRGITSDALTEILTQLPQGVTELACHPGEGEFPNTTYTGERAIEVKTLCDARVRSALIEMGIELCRFTDLPRLLVSSESGSAAP